MDMWKCLRGCVLHCEEHVQFQRKPKLRFQGRQGLKKTMETRATFFLNLCFFFLPICSTSSQECLKTPCRCHSSQAFSTTTIRTQPSWLRTSHLRPRLAEAVAVLDDRSEAITLSLFPPSMIRKIHCSRHPCERRKPRNTPPCEDRKILSHACKISAY